jgi:N-acetyl-gamma-glutamyl-phosphate reductase
MLRVSVVGALGYAGAELVRLLQHHQEVQLTVLADKLEKTVTLSSVYPQFRGELDAEIMPADLDRIVKESDVVFLALPHKVSQEYAVPLYKKGESILDLSADFRFDDVALYEQTYGVRHLDPQLNSEAIYGLPELFRDAIRKARIVAVPGCYPTSVILGCAPLVEKDFIDPHSIIADAKSGVSGGGRSPTPATHFPECNESLAAYSVARHRHTPEIEEKLSALAGMALRITFTPHLVPMNRGILSTIYMKLKSMIDEESILRRYQEFYKDAPFVRVLSANTLPSTRAVAYSNFCDIAAVVDARTKRVIVLTAIDNLVKGAAGQAVQCMNLMCGFPETAGLL